MQIKPMNQDFASAGSTGTSEHAVPVIDLTVEAEPAPHGHAHAVADDDIIDLPGVVKVV